MLVLWSSSRLQLRRQNGRTERAPFYNWRSLVFLGFGRGFCSMVHMMIHDAPLYNWHSLLLVFSAPGFYNRPLPFHVLSAFMINYCYLITSTILDFAQSVFCSVLLYHTWQTQVKETLVEGKDGVHGPHGVHAHLCSREPFFQSFLS